MLHGLVRPEVHKNRFKKKKFTVFTSNYQEGTARGRHVALCPHRSRPHQAVVASSRGPKHLAKRMSSKRESDERTESREAAADEPATEIATTRAVLRSAFGPVCSVDGALPNAFAKGTSIE